MHWIGFISNQSFMNILHGHKLVRYLNFKWTGWLAELFVLGWLFEFGFEFLLRTNFRRFNFPESTFSNFPADQFFRNQYSGISLILLNPSSTHWVININSSNSTLYIFCNWFFFIEKKKYKNRELWELLLPQFQIFQGAHKMILELPSTEVNGLNFTIVLVWI